MSTMSNILDHFLIPLHFNDETGSNDKLSILKHLINYQQNYDKSLIKSSHQDINKVKC